MSSKTAKRKRDFIHRKDKRAYQVKLKEDWLCSCGTKVSGQFTICLCGKLRKDIQP